MTHETGIFPPSTFPLQPSVPNRLPPPGATVVVAMSGGVDSSVAAALLQEHGYEVIGITMHLWDYAQTGGNVHREHGCCTIDDRNDARVVANRLGIPYYVVDFREEFKKGVIDRFVSEYLEGRTPNPCVACNSEVKFGILMDRARHLGADFVATGHYARITQEAETGRYQLRVGLDVGKDQSYALWELSQEELAQTVYPVGGLTKEETRRIAQRLAPRVAAKKDSYEICFIQDENYGRFLEEYTDKVSAKGDGLLRIENPIRPGPIVNTKGAVLGEHRGYPFYTIGQRKGLGLAAGHPVYVVDIRPETNTVVVGDDDDLLANTLIADRVNWVSIAPPKGAVAGQVKIRYRSGAAPAVITPETGDSVRVDFDTSQRAVTPGQSVVFYEGEIVLGGGIIRK